MLLDILWAIYREKQNSKKIVLRLMNRFLDELGREGIDKDSLPFNFFSEDLKVLIEYKKNPKTSPKNLEMSFYQFFSKHLQIYHFERELEKNRGNYVIALREHEGPVEEQLETFDFIYDYNKPKSSFNRVLPCGVESVSSDYAVQFGKIPKSGEVLIIEDKTLCIPLFDNLSVGSKYLPKKKKPIPVKHISVVEGPIKYLYFEGFEIMGEEQIENNRRYSCLLEFYNNPQTKPLTAIEAK